MSKLKQLFTNWKIVILLILLALSYITIRPDFGIEGVAIRSVTINSTAANAGFESPKPTVSPRNREVITTLNSVVITDSKSYNDALKTLKPGMNFIVQTNKKTYKMMAEPKYDIKQLDEKEEKIITETILVNRTVNGTLIQVPEQVQKTILVNKVKKEIIGIQDFGLKVYDAPKTNIRMGLDLQGGTRVLLQPETQVSPEDMDTLLTSMKERLNVYGLSDVTVRESGDLSGNTYILVEIAGANEQEVKELLAKQGKFEANIGNDTVFIGGKRDITYVCRSADCSGIDPMAGCGQMQDGQWSCRFRFSIALSPEAAERQASITNKLQIVTSDPTGGTLAENNQYLSKQLDLILDNVKVDSLNIGADLKGSKTTEIAVSGSGVGLNQQQAMFDSLDNMKRLQTYLSTGSLPVKINIVKSDTISPALGVKFIKNALLVGFLAMCAVAINIMIRYRKLRIALPVIIFSVSEVILLLGVASIIGWNLDLAAIAAIIIIIGTSVDHLIIISDEVLRGSTKSMLTTKNKIKNAFAIIIGVFFTNFVAMIPLITAGAGLLKGFALTTMIGISLGVFVARPAFAEAIDILMKE